MDPPKKPSTPLPSTWHDEGLEFEITDFGEARRILDDESISQFHVETVASPAHWKRLRRATLPTDHALSGQAIDWLLSLAPGLRPQKLTAQFPRIAHALAVVWHEKEAWEHFLKSARGEAARSRLGGCLIGP